MINRQLHKWLESQRTKPQVSQIYGLRQTGKTTLMLEFSKELQNLHLYSLQDLVTLREYESAPENWVLEIENIVHSNQNIRQNILIDEIQKIPALFQGIQGLYDQYKGKLKFWIWGSSARAVKRKNAETLAGRILGKTLWPLSQVEVLSSESIIPKLETIDTVTGVKSRPRGYMQKFTESLVRKSMLPEPFLQKDTQSADELLQGYQVTYLENEIRRENMVSDIGVFEQFLRVAASYDGGIVNYSNIGSTLGVSYQTVKNYYNILSDTFVIKPLRAYSSSIKVQQAKSPKIYFTDTGLARFVSGKRHSPVFGTPEFGAVFEGFVINEFRKQVEYHGLPWNLTYLRTKNGREIDLVVQTPNVVFGIEIKGKITISSKDTTNLDYVLNQDNRIRFGIIISLMPGCRQIKPNIYTLPVWCL